MENSEPDLLHIQSFSIIEQMIAAAKNEHSENGDGWLLFLSSIRLIVLPKTSTVYRVDMDNNDDNRLFNRADFTY